ncbi:hypothetical protein EDB86DRAFT_3081036 [Lactarius hatsudake]|nr:hypothetical protein EDB86DRAFT_3081036 [Lactarius hatsudake]
MNFLNTLPRRYALSLQVDSVLPNLASINHESHVLQISPPVYWREQFEATYDTAYNYQSVYILSLEPALPATL